MDYDLKRKYESDVLNEIKAKRQVIYKEYEPSTISSEKHVINYRELKRKYESTVPDDNPFKKQVIDPESNPRSYYSPVTSLTTSSDFDNSSCEDPRDSEVIMEEVQEQTVILNGVVGSFESPDRPDSPDRFMNTSMGRTDFMVVSSVGYTGSFRW